MKRTAAFLTAFLLIFSFPSKADGEKIYISDINAYINYLWIPSYNLDGVTAVIVRDLENYGYSVQWNESSNTVKIYHSPENTETPHVQEYHPPQDIGLQLYKTYPSDIKVYFEGRKIPSVNIGGRTAIRLRDMDIEHNLSFDARSKKASLNIGMDKLNEKELEYINTFYDILSLIVRGDYERIKIEAMINSGVYNKKTMNDFKAYIDGLTSLMDDYKTYAEPEGFSESSMELWWAAVNSRYASCAIYDMGTNLGNKTDNPMLSLYIEQYKTDSAWQRENAMAILAQELKSKNAETNK